MQITMVSLYAIIFCPRAYQYCTYQLQEMPSTCEAKYYLPEPSSIIIACWQESQKPWKWILTHLRYLSDEQANWQIRPGQIYWQSVMESMGPALKPVVGRRPQSLDKILRKLGCEFWVSNSSTQLFIFKRARGANFCIPTNTSVYRRGRRLCVIVCPLSLPIKIQPRGYKYRIRHQERTRTSLLLVAVLPWLTLWTPLPSIA